MWGLTDADGTSVRLALPATKQHVRVLTWLVEQSRLLAVTVVGDRPEAVFLPAGTLRAPGQRPAAAALGVAAAGVAATGVAATGVEASGVELVSLTLSPLPLRTIGPSWRHRILKLDQHRRAEVPLREPTELERLVFACGDVVEALAASGRPTPSPRQAATLAQRARQADDLGLTTLGSALRTLLAPGVMSPDVLWARFILDRAEARLR